MIFGLDGAPVAAFALFSRGVRDADDFGATHPVVRARAVMGRAFLNSVTGAAGRRTPGRRSRAGQAGLVRPARAARTPSCSGSAEPRDSAINLLTARRYFLR
ncbi:hypothetical protein AHOG_21505 [Actinoalloteichus hoggarensis]|uniref:Uncharacterized protein n=1 Tax=Actinoalloteichus hoggarensis TaxID=1470176 RepID=A0A221W964_9PSEU|nr:hypothetical protein AHOG_21505 [Actinoalloteichus hoggarensis]